MGLNAQYGFALCEYIHSYGYRHSRNTQVNIAEESYTSLSYPSTYRSKYHVVTIEGRHGSVIAFGQAILRHRQVENSRRVWFQTIAEQKKGIQR